MKNYSKVEHMKFSIAMLVLLLSMLIIVMLSGCGFGSQSFTISGTITSGGSPLSGATMTLSGDGSGVVTTDTNGNYKFDVDNYSTYTLTPSRAGYTFRPINRIVYISGGSGEGINFSGFGSGEVSTSYHTVYLKSDGTVWAWGLNTSGQLGDGTNNNRNTPEQIGTDTNWAAVSAGGYHTIALKSNGTVWAWGLNTSGQLGDGTNNNRNTPEQIGTDTNWAAVSAGYNFTVAVKRDGTVWAWGSNSYGQLGNNSTTDSNTPVPVSGTSGLSNVIGVAAGHDHTVAFTNSSSGTVWTWGNNSYGQLGNGTNGTGTNSTIPVQVGGLGNIMAIAAGNAFTVALRNDALNSSVWAWGSNSNGQLGNGTNGSGIYSNTPGEVSGMVGTGAIGIAAGDSHAVAMKTDGTVWAWGSNTHGQLGNGTTTDSVTPVQVSGMSGVEAVAAGYSDTVALKIDSTVWAWGSNSNGQLGNGTTTDSNTPVQAM